MFLIMYYVIPYRKALVKKQLLMVFPEKSEAERKEIMRKFYQHFCDLVIESIKGFTISREEIAKRHKCINPELMDNLFVKGQSVVGITAHYNSWEWYPYSGPVFFKHGTGAVYTTIQNPAFERLILDSRQRFGMRMIPAKKAIQFYEELEKRPMLLCLAADQCPTKVRKSFWTMFLNQETPVFFGPEKLSKEYNCATVYFSTQKVKRSYYEYEMFLITDTPKETPYGYITQEHLKILEQDIHANPEYWLWTHRRWKRTRPEDVPMSITGQA
jgi:KDO2-lipid IV(A) lauroyltransferase